MASPPDRSMTAPVFDLSRFRRRPLLRDAEPCATAQLLSLRRGLSFEASIEIDDLDLWLHRLHAATGATIEQRVRQLLDREFGRLRVHRSRRHYIVRHRSADSLMAGVLRVQYHVRQIALPLRDARGERIDPASITLTWGVGNSAREAEMERLRRRRKKRQSRG